jgi:uncharacterized coiled-coil protein SlyX
MAMKDMDSWGAVEKKVNEQTQKSTLDEKHINEQKALDENNVNEQKEDEDDFDPFADEIDVNEQEKIIKQLNEQLEHKNLSINNLSEQYKENKETIILLNQKLEGQELHIKQLNEQLAEKLSMINQLNDQLSRSKMDCKNSNNRNTRLQKKFTELEESIILSTKNANRNGRPKITDKEIEQIQELRAKGYTQRKVAEMLQLGNGTVAKYSKGLFIK